MILQYVYNFTKSRNGGPSLIYTAKTYYTTALVVIVITRSKLLQRQTQGTSLFKSAASSQTVGKSV